MKILKMQDFLQKLKFCTSAKVDTVAVKSKLPSSRVPIRLCK